MSVDKGFIIGVSLSDEDAHKIIKQLQERGREAFRKVEAKHGRPVAVYVSEMANLVNIATSLQRLGAGGIALSMEIVDCVTRMSRAVQQVHNLSEKEAGDMVIEVAEARSYQPVVDPSKVN